VYRARDTRLERDVAVKVLPSSFSADGSAPPKGNDARRYISSLRLGVMSRR